MNIIVTHQQTILAFQGRSIPFNWNYFRIFHECGGDKCENSPIGLFLEHSTSFGRLGTGLTMLRV